MDFTLSPEQQAIREEVRSFARREIAPHAREMDASGGLPQELLSRLAEAGFFGCVFPAQYGGRGWDELSFVLACEELGRVCSSVRGLVTVEVALCGQSLLAWGNEAQQQRYLAGLCSGKSFGCYALTEPGAGSDVASLQTTAVRQRSEYVLNGVKHWISLGLLAHWAIVFATVDPALRHRGVTAFLVSTDSPGFERERMPGQQLGHRATDHARITLRNCRVGSEQVLGGVGEGFKVAMSALDHGRLGVAAGAVGVLQACLEASVHFARTRQQFGRPIGQFEMIQQVLADMAADTEAARLLVYRAAAEKDNGKRRTQAIALAKLFATEAAVRAANQAVLLHGSYGYSNEYPVERHLRDSKGFQIYEGTSHIQRIIIARALLEQET